MADFGGSDLDAFRAEARQWLEANFPKSLAFSEAALIPGGEKPTGDALLWKQRMAEKGWGTPTWPTEYGGGGLSGPQGRIVQQEMERLGAYNPMAGMGISMFGPTLLEYGTEDQKARHIPPIVKGELRWCQGYSEPGAGSDLASLQTKLEDRGDHWVVNGQKIWTSGAQWADWCFCLVRTDTTKKHEGISFVLINMRQPGVETRPIKLIAGNSPFCETFFTDARVEKNDMVGPLNGGWTIGKRLLQHERSGQGGARMMMGPNVVDLAKRYVGLDASGRLADQDLRTRIAKHQIDAKAHTLTLKRAADEAKGNQNPSATTSVMKNSGTWIGQEKAELLLEIMGSQGLGWEGDEYTKEERDAVRSWLSGKATTIFGGSQEIQSNIVSKRILGLPDTTQNG
ncbi:acyl-CoA dehydrogenase family protein [Phenylobacterium soli]|uniref:Acyl-CoA dehydrogenase n=1 Tax=Phenylobacterium soli TaxID=2170551 RepID=A0A328AHY9_9CAUL|nr:acyl-CoA dehydrogenase family protein [Phenylobacterium soli]RAK54380.1 acyl-CoA dehydrogenase [Phenylobacterium soli]